MTTKGKMYVWPIKTNLETKLWGTADNLRLGYLSDYGQSNAEEAEEEEEEAATKKKQRRRRRRRRRKEKRRRI